MMYIWRWHPQIDLPTNANEQERTDLQVRYVLDHSGANSKHWIETYNVNERAFEQR